MNILLINPVNSFCMNLCQMGSSTLNWLKLNRFSCQFRANYIPNGLIGTLFDANLCKIKNKLNHWLKGWL